MLKTFRIAALSALVGLGSLAVIPAAQADGIYFSIGQSYHGPVYRHHNRRPRHAMRGCSPQEAVRKAAHFGISRAHVSNMSRRTITVRGHKYHRPAAMVFARAPHCPVVR